MLRAILNRRDLLGGDDLGTIDFNQLYEVYSKQMLYIAYKYTKDFFHAEDVVQEAFLKAYKKMDSIGDTKKIGAWLSAITARTAIDFLRMEKRKGCIPIDDTILEPMAGTAENTEDIEEEVFLRLFQEEVGRTMETLSAQSQEVLKLKIQHGLKENEIACILNLKSGTVKTRLYRARKQLKRCLTPTG
ncbi:RNA polymerase sigma factor [Neobacillus mesonae]|uniref:RNA polymerase sigma factor n=1 Tax=Neobacillus mesonae TaxID=1193713 RepID=UPI00203EABD7|nr:sigma-70 family RNA polymerase sigma factor [Neobacillus mesonae]MCM3571033.1 sigma-70 family RNA polymerase sigma factor [Neobacillus mesonae]